jgi:NADH-quinone oxidoreductase subunit N
MQFNFPVPSIDFLAIFPMIIVAVTGMLALLFDMGRKNKDNGLIIFASLLGLATAFVALLSMANRELNTFGGMIVMDRLALVGQLVTVISAFLVILFSDSYLQAKKISFGEFYPLILWATLGGMIMCCTHNLLVLFIGIEVLSISLYVLAGMSRGEVKSEEAAMKYFLLGAFATGFLLYGIAFFYGGTGSLELGAFASAWQGGDSSIRLLLGLSIGLLMIGLGFKSSLVPFHQWTPDVYQGSPTNVSAFMATGGKAGPFIAMFNFAIATGLASKITVPAFAVLAVVTMTIGNILAMVQKDVKRLLAYSSVANAGYVMVAITTASNRGGSVASLAFFVIGYVFTTVGTFAIISMTATDGKEATSLDDLKGLRQRAPLAAGALVIFVLSLIGIPITAGFFGKLLLVKDAVSADMTWLAVVLVLNSIMGAVYYFGLLKAAFSPEVGDERGTFKLNSGLTTVLVICMVGVVGSAVLYQPIMNGLGIR